MTIENYSNILDNFYSQFKKNKQAEMLIFCKILSENLIIFKIISKNWDRDEKLLWLKTIIALKKL